MFVRIANLLALVAVFSMGQLPFCAVSARAETLGEYWDTAEEESKYYRIVEIPMPAGAAIEAGCFEVMPDNQLAIGTRRGDIFLVKGAFDKNPRPTYKRFAHGLDEVMGMAYRDKAFVVTQQTEVTRITDENEDARRVILKTVEQPQIVILKEDIEARKISSKSMMPDGQLEQMKPQEMLDLIKYLRTTAQVEMAK